MLKDKSLTTLKVIRDIILCKDFFITFVGTCLGALFAFCIAYHVYESQSKFKATVNLQMVQQEMALNKVMFKLIEKSMDEWLKNEKNPKGPLVIQWRLNTNSLLMASQSEDVYYNSSPHIVAGIYGHLMKLQSLNSELDAFNEVLYKCIENPNINKKLFISWVKSLKDRIGENYDDSTTVYDYLSKYLKVDSQQKRIRISWPKASESEKS